jgi:hypothetical protein
MASKVYHVMTPDELRKFCVKRLPALHVDLVANLTPTEFVRLIEAAEAVEL